MPSDKKGRAQVGTAGFLVVIVLVATDENGWNSCWELAIRVIRILRLESDAFFELLSEWLSASSNLRGLKPWSGCGRDEYVKDFSTPCNMVPER